MIRPYTIDVFILRQLVKQLDSEVDEHDRITDLLLKEDFISLAYFILNNKTTPIVDTITPAIEFFNHAGLSLNSAHEINSYNKITTVIPFINPRTILLSRVIHWFVLLKKIKLGKNLFVHTDPTEIVMYETILTDLTPQGNTSKYPLLPVLQARNILPQAAIYSIDRYNYLSLFKSKRATCNIVNAYNYNWEYYASFSPLWERRIKKCNGVIDHNAKSIIFEDEDDMEKFYLHYGLDTEEQPTRIQEKSIKPIVKEQTWVGFYNKHKQTGIVDIDSEYLNELECIEY
jgi:hypothetical protein